MKRAPWPAVVTVLAAGCAAAGGHRELDVGLAELLARPELAGGRVGVCVVDAADGATLAAASADRGFATASNMKLVGTAVAFATLGGDHRFTTELWRRGEVRADELVGDLVVRGFGDPTFGHGRAGATQLATLVAAVRERGVRRVRGDVAGDAGWLGGEHLGLGWQWDYLDEDYAAPFGALCCAGNVVVVTVTAGPDGPRVAMVPDVLPSPRLAVQQVAATADAVTRLAVHRALGSDVITVTGTLRADAPPQVVQVPVPDPTAFAAAVLRAELASAGVVVEGMPAPAPAAVGEPALLARVSSAPLRELAPHLLQQSDNLWAEQFVRVAARVATGDGGTASMQRHVFAVLGGWGIDTAGMVVADGSGLSRRNLVQPRQLAGVLAAAWRAPWRDDFVAALPLAGVTGTLRTRFADGPAHARVRAKTGYISRVVCLSGFVPRPDPAAPPLVFSVMLNDFTCSDALAKAAVDAFVQRLAAFAGW